MSEKKSSTTKNPMADLLARKKSAQTNNIGTYNTKGNFKGKVNTKGFGGPSSVRKAGRGS